MALDQRKYERKHTDVLRDLRPAYIRLADWMRKPANSAALFMLTAFLIYQNDRVVLYADVIFLVFCVYFFWLTIQDRSLAFKMPFGAKWKDKRNEGPGRSGRGEGILFLGNVKDTNEEMWFTNSDARTHILYLGTTGSGKTEGLKSMVTNAMTWGSGFIYVDGKADTDLWSSLSSLVRRFGRDDDLLVLNYMTGNSDSRAPSNTMNPFSSGSASYLTNMLVSLMPESEGDNAMWKERAVSLVASLMPALTWKRDNQDIPMSVSTIREYLNLNNIIRISRDEVLPEDIRLGIKGYLDTLPGYIDAAFDDNGEEKPPGPDQPQYDTTTPRQQHGYLSMQFTRSLQSLGDEYGYIFDSQAADVDMVDVVLNRRILVVLIPALEKSSDETANLGKIVAATLKGMMGSTLGSTVEGESSTVIENKPTHSSTPFMTVFDEVGYYTAQGMAVMAAQARSLGFCLVYSSQDLPAMKKRVREEANSITANCNIKIFGKLEDPTETKDFFEKTVGSALVIESSGFQLQGGRSTGTYTDSQQAGLQIRPRASYDGLRGYTEGQACVAFGEMVVDGNMFYSNPGHAKAMRVTRFIALPPPDENFIKHADAIGKVRDLMVHKTWTAMKADVKADIPEEIAALAKTVADAGETDMTKSQGAMAAIAAIHVLENPIDWAAEKEKAKETGDSGGAGSSSSGGGGKAPAAPAAPQAKPADKPAAAQPAKPAAPAKKSPATEDNKPETPLAPEPEKAANPMSFFASKKEEGASGEASDKKADTSNAPSASSSSQTETPPAQPVAQPPAKEGKAEASATSLAQQPLATAAPTSAPAPAEGKTEDKTGAKKEGPISWEDLIAETEGRAGGAGAEPKREIPPLDKTSEQILSRAGEETRDALFKKKDEKKDDGEKA